MPILNKMKLFLTIVVSLTLLASCASTQEIKILAENNAKIAQFQASVIQRPTLEIKCGKDNESCKGLYVSYTDQRDRQKVTASHITNTNDVIIGIAPDITRAVGFIAGAVAVTKIVSDVSESMGGNNSVSHTTTSIAGDDNTVSPTTDMAKISHDGAENNDNSATASPTVVDPVIVDPVIVDPVVQQP